MMNMKKWISMVLALVILLAMSATAMAYTITSPVDSTHNYEVYQIFTGDLHDGLLSNIKWGKNGTGTVAELVPDDVLTAIKNVSSGTDTQILNVIKSYAKLNADEKYGTVNAGGELENVPAGYYLIKDVDNEFTGDYEAYTMYILMVVGDVTIDPKSSVPEVEKKVKDTNDTDNTPTGWQDSADHDIGDDVPFQLTAKLGEDLTGYDSYKIVFHDTLSAGLTYNNDFTVKIDGKTVDCFTATSDGNALTFTCDNVLAHGADKNSVIVVEYTARLNENAVIGYKGNPNEVYLEFSNNPNVGTETGKTPTDKVIVFTYEVVVDKVDEKGAELKGASFKLSKEVNGKWVEIKTIDGTNLSTFTWTGLDDGKYQIEETVTPAGYNTIAPIEFIITAEHDDDSKDPKLTKLEVEGGDFTVEMEKVEGSENNNITGVLSGKVVNEKGATLPDTGAQGTKMLYIVGGILVAVAAVLLITKRRVNAEK